MKLVVVAVFDKAAECFGRPAFFSALGLAVRQFTDEINRAAQDNMMYLHPDDYTLYHMGSFEDTEGSFDLSNRPERLASGSSVKVRNEAAK